MGNLSDWWSRPDHNHLTQVNSELARLKKARDRAGEDYRLRDLTYRETQKALQTAGLNDPSLGKRTSAADLVFSSLQRRPEIIHGLLRQGEILNIIAAPKTGKSWLSYYLLGCLANGLTWLGMKTETTACLLIDNELHTNELKYRFREVSAAMNIRLEHCTIDVESMRGKHCTLETIDKILNARKGCYGFVLIDAFYRILPPGMDENDNGAMTGIFNQLDGIASEHDVSIGQIHHTSKGNQAMKAITDVGAGAGAMTRACDTHLIIRPHEKAGYCVFDAEVRSNKKLTSISAKLDWPVWQPDLAVTPTLKQAHSRSDAKKQKEDLEGKNSIMKVLGESATWLSRTSIRKKAGMGVDRCNRLLRQLLDEEPPRIETEERTNPSNKKTMADYFKLSGTDDPDSPQEGTQDGT